MNLKIFNKGDWRVLVICLLIAVAFWFINSLNKEYTFEISYPLRVAYDETKYIPTNGLPSKIRLSARANGWDLLANAVGWNANEIVIDLKSFKNNRLITSKKLLTIIDDYVSNMEIIDLIEDFFMTK